MRLRFAPAGAARADIVCRQLQLCRGDPPLRKAPGLLLPQAAAALEQGQEAIAGQQMQAGAGTGAGYGIAFTAEEDMRIAAVSIGYADGLPRELSHGKGSVLIGGHRAPIIGRICMDQKGQ